MQGALKVNPMTFKFEPEYRQKLETLADYYGTKNMTKAMRKMIDDTYNAQIINQTQINKDGKLND